MRKKHTKVKVSYSIDKDIEKQFNEQADRLAINRSALVEKFIQRWTKENKDRDEA